MRDLHQDEQHTHTSTSGQGSSRQPTRRGRRTRQATPSTRAPITAATVTSAPRHDAGPRPAQTTPAMMSNPPVVDRERPRHLVPAAEPSPEHRPQQHDGHHPDGKGRSPHQRRERHPGGTQARVREQVGQVRHRQNERGRVGQPDGGEGEPLLTEPKPPGQHQHHRRQQHRRRVQGQHRGGDRDHQHHQQPQSQHRAPPQHRGPAGDDRKQTDAVGESATTVIATRKTRIGPTRTARPPKSANSTSRP